MTITIELPPESERRLRELASRSGQDVETYARGLIDRGIAAASSLDAILAPVRQQFAASGMTDDDLAALVEEARDELWREKARGGSR